MNLRIVLCLTLWCVGLVAASPLLAQEQKSRTILKGHTEPVTCVAFSIDGLLASAGMDRTIKLWDLSTGKQKATLQGHTDSVVSVVFGPDGKTVASASADKTVKLWDVTTHRELAFFQGHSVAFAPGGRTLATACKDRTIRLWDIETGKERATSKGTAALSTVWPSVRTASWWHRGVPTAL